MEVYRKLCETMAKRGGRYPGVDIPEFYDLARELFTSEEAAVACAMPLRPSPAAVIAREMGRSEEEVRTILEAMADKGLSASFTRGGIRCYVASPFVPGIFELQFMKGTRTDRDRKLARLIHSYKEAVDRMPAVQGSAFPSTRVIPVEKNIHPGSRVHTYQQVSSYIERYDPIAVSTCYCRHEGKLLDEKGDCGKPDEVCLQFGMGAQYIIERGFGRRITKDEARGILAITEEAGLVHASINSQEIDFICNCCPCHCVLLKSALRYPKPTERLSSGFQPIVSMDLCTGCRTCVERCPAKALTFGEFPAMDPDRCLGCGVCSTGCPSQAILMQERPGAAPPPVDRKALREALESSRV